MCCYEATLQDATEEITVLFRLIGESFDKGRLDLHKALGMALWRCEEHYRKVLGAEVIFTLKYYANPKWGEEMRARKKFLF